MQNPTFIVVDMLLEPFLDRKKQFEYPNMPSSINYF